MHQIKPASGIVELEYRFRCPVSAAFEAWSDRKAVELWGHPGEGWTMSIDRFSFHFGNSDLVRFGPAGGAEYVNENRYIEIVKDSRIIYSSTVSSGRQLQFAGIIVVQFEPLDGGGTLMRFVEQGLYLDAADSVEGHRAGWQQMFDALRKHAERAQPALAAAVA